MKIFSPVLKGTTTVSDGTTNLSGSFTGSLQGTAATASLANTASYVVSSQTDATQNTRLQTLESTTGSYASTSSLSTSNSRITTLESITGSFTLTSSFGSYTASNDSTNTTQNARLLSVEQKTGSFATTGSNAFSGSQIITGSLTATGTITAQTLVVQTVTSSVVYSSGSNIFGLNTGNTHQFTGSVYQSGSTAAFMGNVGIGTSSPNSILEIASTTPVLRIQASDSGSFHGIEFRQGAGFDSFIKQLPSTGEFKISNGRSSGWGGFITLYTDTAERMRITSAGAVGIGTSSPGVSLDVSGSGIRIIHPTAPNVYLNNTTVQWKSYLPSGSNNFAINDAVRDVLVLGYNGAASYFSGSNVGIGTTSPVRKLDIVTTGEQLRLSYDGSTTYTDFRNDSAGGLLINTSAGYIIHYISGSEKMRITSAGTVGIGLTSPVENFHVIGNIKAQQTSNSAAYLTLNANSTALGSSYQWNLVATNSSSNYGFQIREASTSYIHINNSAGGNAGYVGIGTTSPSEKLHVAGNIKVTVGDIDVDSTTSYIRANNTRIAGTDRKIQVWNNVSAYIDVLTMSAAGTSTFSSDVVLGNGKFLQAARNTGGALIDIIGIQSGTDTLQIKGGTSGGTNAINFYDTGGVIATFYNSRLGIGTTSPSYKLEISGTTTTELRLIDSGDVGFQMVSSGNSNAFSIRTNGSTVVMSTSNSRQLNIGVNASSSEVLGSTTGIAITSGGAVAFASTVTTGDVLYIGAGGGGGGYWTWGGSDSYILAPTGKNLHLYSGDTGTNGVKISTTGLATFYNRVIATGFKTSSGEISIASGASANIYAMSDNGLYTAQIIVAGGSLIYSAAAIFYSHSSNSQFIKTTDLYDGSNVTLDNSGTYIRITNNGFSTLTWNWSVKFQSF